MEMKKKRARIKRILYPAFASTLIDTLYSNQTNMGVVILPFEEVTYVNFAYHERKVWAFFTKQNRERVRREESEKTVCNIALGFV